MSDKKSLIQAIKQYESEFSLDQAAYLDTKLREAMRTEYSHLINILHGMLHGYFFIRAKPSEKYTELIIGQRYVDNRLIRTLEHSLDRFNYRMYVDDQGALHIIIPDQPGFNLREFLINYKKVDMISSVRDITHPVNMVGTSVNDRSNLLEITRYFDCESIVHSIDSLASFTPEEGLGSYQRVSCEYLKEYLNRARDIAHIRDEVARGVGINTDWAKLFTDHLYRINVSMGYRSGELRMTFKNEAEIPNIVMVLNGFIPNKGSSVPGPKGDSSFIPRQIDRFNNTTISIPMSTEEAMDALGTINKMKRLSDDKNYTIPRFIQ